MSSETKPWRHAETVEGLSVLSGTIGESVLALTILSHPDPGRIGEVSRLEPLLRGRPVSISRLEPLFRAPSGAIGESLADSRLSRKAVVISKTPLGVRLDPTGTTTRVDVDGAVLTEPLEMSDSDLEHGRAFSLGRTISLLLHSVPPVGRRPPRLGLIGDSPGLDRVRMEVERVADLDVPVLLRGESGVGKELVARALHDASRRRGGPFVAVNMAAIPASTAASELFGHVRGAFTGALRDHDGFFARAHGGTLFLDEIGDTPAELQPMLLRVLETGEVQRVGATKTQRFDVRVVAATDQNLDAMLGDRFRIPLFHRLAGYTIAIPPLRERRDDVARLFAAFLAAELTNTGEAHQMAPRKENETPYIPTEMTLEFASYAWPGNVRELRNAARHAAIGSRGNATLKAPALGRLPSRGTGNPALASSSSATVPVVEAPGTARPANIDEDTLIAALEAHSWKPGPTAQALGISRTTLYALIERSSRLRKARDVPEAELTAAIAAAGGDLDLVAAELHVSKRGLQLRLKELAPPGPA